MNATEWVAAAAVLGGLMSPVLTVKLQAGAERARLTSARMVEQRLRERAELKDLYARVMGHAYRLSVSRNRFVTAPQNEALTLFEPLRLDVLTWHELGAEVQLVAPPEIVTAMEASYQPLMAWADRDVPDDPELLRAWTGAAAKLQTLMAAHLRKLDESATE